MATIRKRNQKYQVQVRKNRYQTVSKSSLSLSVARSWAKVIEAVRERRIYICPQETLVVRGGPLRGNDHPNRPEADHGLTSLWDPSAGASDIHRSG